ncbi:hypothetical protein OUZ56_033788 [Daphnia magna]|uniref:Uncharacterized protein n=1 Tax=Daphnia magna TaxID=35525 RepID=A0ABR0BB51_9CRUS|nr:hypothetical protein OUZ56_021688 [Daphnia magna]KAK4045798.1 hypothetical protein OUZ56_033788 [Daphnia magna]
MLHPTLKRLSIEADEGKGYFIKLEILVEGSPKNAATSLNVSFVAEAFSDLKYIFYRFVGQLNSLSSLGSDIMIYLPYSPNSVKISDAVMKPE